MPKKIQLSKEIITHKGPVREIELRDISAQDMIEVGTNPLTFINLADSKATNAASNRKDQKVEIRYDVAGEYVVRLSGIDKILLGQMNGKDFQKCVSALIEMWTEAEGE